MSSHPLTAESLSGTYTAIVTPFTQDGGAVDYQGLEALIEDQIAAKVDGIVVCGSTGEAATLSDEEYRTVITTTVKLLKGRLPCIAGIGTNSTNRAVESAKFLSQTGVDGVMVVAPPYNKPTQEGIILHFEAVRAATSLPIIAYNVPGRSAVNILPATIAELAKRNLIIGVKEASGSMDQVLDLLSLVQGKIAVLSGEDSLTHVLMASGGQGVISVVSNVAPKLVVAITDAASRGDWGEACTAQRTLLPWVRAMFMETNPIPVKTAVAMRGVIRHPTLRLPLTAAVPQTVTRIKELLATIR